MSAMNRRTSGGLLVFVVCLLVFVVCLALLLTCAAHRIGNSATQKVQKKRYALEANLNSHVHQGSDAAAVSSFLDSQGIAHTGYESANGDKVTQSVLGAPAVIEARVPVSTWSLTKYSIHVVFRFDSKGCFVAYTDMIEGTFY
jgi:hypothetical protein